MKVVGVISMIFWLSCAVSGILSANGGQVPQVSVKGLHPPFANERYQCRCFPVLWEVRGETVQDAVYHSKICEYKTYITSLKRHVDFLTAVCAGKQAELAEWFVDQGRIFDAEVVGSLHKAIYEKRVGSQIKRELSMALNYFQTRQNLNINDVANEERLATNEQIYQRRVEPIMMKYKKLIPASKRCFDIIHVANWFWDKACDVFRMGLKAFFTETTGTLLKDFPWASAEDAMRTATFKKVVHNFKENFLLTDFVECWNALSTIKFEEADDAFETLFSIDLANTSLMSTAPDNATEKRITYAFLLLKDFSDLTTLMMHHVTKTLAEGLDNKKTLTDEQRALVKAVTLDQLVSLYEKLNQLPIAGTLDVLNTFSQQCAMIFQLFQQDTTVDFATWFKNNWVTFPLIIGVIIIKIAQYYGNCGITSVGQDTKFA